MKFYPLTNIEKERKIIDFLPRLSDSFHSFYGTSTEKDVEKDEGKIKYRFGITDYLTLGLYPILLTIQEMVKEGHNKNEPLAGAIAFFGIVPFVIAMGALLIAKAAISAVCAFLLTAAITIEKIGEFVVNNDFATVKAACRMI